jgi:acyl-[acyl-carrier-protein] desaturase
MDDVALITELAPVAESLVERHLSRAQEWFPHALVPWGRGQDFEPDYEWDPAESGIEDPAVRSALFVNLLTEDNLPHYFETIYNLYGRDSGWGEWSMRWCAEEGRHAIVIRDYLTVTRAVDPVALERGRMSQISQGMVPRPQTVVDGLVYVTLQELATRISHSNTGKLITDPVGTKIMKRVAADEQLHYNFYRDMTSAALEVDASTVILALERQVRDFEMPGVGIPDFATHASAIAKAEIYDFLIHHDEILQPVVIDHWKADKVEGLTAEAEAARERLMRQIDRVGRIGRRLRDRAASEPTPALT